MVKKRDIGREGGQILGIWRSVTFKKRSVTFEKFVRISKVIHLHIWGILQ